MNLKHFLLLLSLTTALLSACAPGTYSSNTLSVNQKTDVGDYLVAQNGFTVYTFAQDTNGTSSCNGDCAVKWPPLLGSITLPTNVGGSLGTVARADGQQQVTYDGKPLYFFSGDKAPGDTNGHGVGSVWFAAKASRLEPTNTTTSSPSSSSY